MIPRPGVKKQRVPRGTDFPATMKVKETTVKEGYAKAAVVPHKPVSPPQKLQTKKVEAPFIPMTKRERKAEQKRLKELQQREEREKRLKETKERKERQMKDQSRKVAACQQTVPKTIDPIIPKTPLTTRRDKGSTAIFIDLEKAFELSNPTIMLTSLISAGIKGNLIKWLQNYLSDRKATLLFQGAKSDTSNFDNGTPQGSTLSPTLFIYLVDQLHSVVLPRGVKMLTYAL